jgi:hypothetical protein
LDFHFFEDKDKDIYVYILKSNAVLDTKKGIWEGLCEPPRFLEKFKIQDAISHQEGQPSLNPGHIVEKPPLSPFWGSISPG